MRTATRVTMLSVVLAAIIVAFSWNDSPLSAAPTGTHAAMAADADSPECPGPYIAIPIFKDSGMTTVLEYRQMVEIADDISKVPEFHDCQRFVIRGDSAPVYGPLYAVFASDRLDQATFLSGGRGSGGLPRAFAAAEVYTKLGNYPALGIKRGFSCLYLSRADTWEAYMFAAGLDDEACGRFLTVEQRAAATKLSVHRTTDSSMKLSDYPGVVRWDRDRDGNYYMTMKCADGWCDVGLPNPARKTPALTVNAAMSVANKRVRTIRGWYDQQVLAVPAGAMSVRPQRFVGTIIPNSGLGDATFDDGVWTPVATIELEDNIDKYSTQLGVKRGPNRVYLRQVGASWEARIDGSDGTHRWFKVTRHGHEGENFKIPGTVRWRWMANDETIWVRCLEGCCEVEVSTGTNVGSFAPLGSEVSRR